MNAEKYRKSDLAFIEDLLDDCFYTFEVELTRRRLATLTQCRTRNNAGI